MIYFYLFISIYVVLIYNLFLYNLILFISISIRLRRDFKIYFSRLCASQVPCKLSQDPICFSSANIIKKRLPFDLCNPLSANTIKWSNTQCRFQKGFKSHCLLAMVETWRKTLDEGGETRTVLTNLTKTFITALTTVC